MTIKYADVMELVDVPDSKSGVGNYVPVRPRPSAYKKDSLMESFLLRKKIQEKTILVQFEIYFSTSFHPL